MRLAAIILFFNLPSNSLFGVQILSVCICVHDLLIISLCVCVYINMNDDYESVLPPAGPEPNELPLRLLECVLHSRNMQKNQEMHIQS